MNIPVCSYRVQDLIPSTSEKEAKYLFTQDYLISNFLKEISNFIQQKGNDSKHSLESIEKVIEEAIVQELNRKYKKINYSG